VSLRRLTPIVTPRRRRRLLAPVTAGVAGVALGAFYYLAVASGFWSGAAQLRPVDLVVLTAAVAVTELLPLRQPGGRSMPASLSVIGAGAMLGAPPAVLTLVAGAGWVLAWTVRGQAMTSGPLLTRLVGTWALTGVAALGAAAFPLRWAGDVVGVGTDAVSLDVGPAIGVGVAILVGGPIIETAVRNDARWRFVPRRLWEAVRGNWLVGTAVASTSVLGALVYPVLGPWTLPTMLVPLFAARIGLDRYDVASNAYDQTIRAMSRLPEQFGTVRPEHGVRVGALAREVALELGLDVATVEATERAAYLHELGRIQFERIDVGQRELAMAGASVLDEAKDLDRVARIVEAHGDLRGPRDASRDRDVGLPARIVAACCEVDRYDPDPSDRGQRHEVTVRLVREIGDLEVVGALTRVLGWADES
jgi:hypothetical protein